LLSATISKIAMFSVCALLLSSCATTGLPFIASPADGDNSLATSNRVESTTPAPISTQSAQPIPTSAQPTPSSAFRQAGDGSFLNPARSRTQVRDTGSGIQLSFQNTPIADVVSAVIGDLLGADFVIDPQVSGVVTLRSARPVAREDLPAALDRALGMTGVSLVESSEGVYYIAPEARAQNFARGPRIAGEGLPPGFGTVIAPLDYVSAREMARLLRPFASDANAIATDEARELVILSGDPAQLGVLLETIALFDVDWLEQMSFALYPLQAAEPDTIIAELNSILGGADGPIGSQLEFVPLARLNAIVVIAKNADRLEQAEDWLSRLDIRADRGRRVRVVPLVNASAEALATQLNDLFAADASEQAGASITVQADTNANALLVIADEDGYDQVLDAVAELDRAPDQVMIQVRIVEVVLNDDLRYGVQWFLDTRDGGQAISTGNAGGGVAASLPGFAYTYASDYFRVAMSAIASVTDVETISTPQIMALDNQPSMIQVGDQVPVVTQSAVSVNNPDAPIVNSVQFRDTGVVLNVTPHISPNGAVTLEVQQEVSSVAETTTSGIDSPTIQQRRFETTVVVHDGQTVALGGLIRTARTQNRSGVPFLQEVPVLGNLFSDTTDTTRRTELIIFLTPQVIRSAEDAAAATRDLRDSLQHIREFGFTDD
jgi:general secretion pathway protein D